MGAFLTHGVACVAGLIVLVVVHLALTGAAPSRRRRFVGRLVAGPAAMSVWVATFHALGRASELTHDGRAVSWRDDLPVAIALGVLYAVLWPLGWRLQEWGQIKADGG